MRSFRAAVRGGEHLAALLVLGAAACGGGSKGKAVADSAKAAPVANAAPAGPAAPPCEKEGEWRLCSLEDRLVHAGLVPKHRDSTVHQPFMSVPGEVYDLGPAELQVYVYPSEAARARDTKGLDSVRVAPPGASVQWRLPPTLIISNNLAAILLSDNERLIERVQLAITAGLPRKK